jgi:hypothetical protein
MKLASFLQNSPTLPSSYVSKNGLGSFRHFYLRSSRTKTFFQNKSAQRVDKGFGRQVFGEREVAG